MKKIICDLLAETFYQSLPQISFVHQSVAFQQTGNIIQLFPETENICQGGLELTSCLPHLHTKK